MQLKAFLGMLLAAAMLCFAAPTRAAAAVPTREVVSPLYEISCDARSELYINSSTATCKSKVTKSDAVKITVVQTLQKQGLLGIWGKYDSKSSWTETVSSSTISFSNTKSGLESGKYRVKSEFTLTDKNGKTATVKVYSDEVSVS